MTSDNLKACSKKGGEVAGAGRARAEGGVGGMGFDGGSAGTFGVLDGGGD